MQLLPDGAGASLRGVVSLTIAVLAAGGCASVPSQSASMQAAPDLVVSANRLQLRTFELGRTLSTLIEQAADSIQAVSTDPVVQQRALLWKISGIPLVQEAALRIDPLVAGVDLIAFTVQQLGYLTTGSGREVFGPQQSIAVAAAAESERRALAVGASSVKGDTLRTVVEANMRRWAANHPMHGPNLTRASVLDSDWDALGLTEQSLQATIGNVDRTLANITYRLSYLNETLAEQARWNAELAVLLAMRSPRADSMFGMGVATLGSVGLFLDSTPTLLDRQREALMREVDHQRILAFADLATQVSQLEAALAAERRALMDQVRQERVAAFLAADSVVTRSLAASDAILRRLVLQIVAGALVVVLALLVSGMLLVKRWKTATT